MPHDVQGKPASYYTTVYKVFAKWADDSSLWQAFVASVRHLAVEKQLDRSVLHGDGTNTVAKKGGMARRTWHYGRHNRGPAPNRGSPLAIGSFDL